MIGSYFQAYLIGRDPECIFNIASDGNFANTQREHNTTRGTDHDMTSDGAEKDDHKELTVLTEEYN